jgi:hypothetical protein
MCGYTRHCQAENPLIVLSRFPEPALSSHKNLADPVLFPLAREENHCESYIVNNPAIMAGTMAENHAQSANHPVMDYAEHEKTYQMFIRAIKWTVAAVVVLLALLAAFLG